MKASMISVLAIVAAAQAGYVVSPPPVESHPAESTSTSPPTSTHEAPKTTYSASSTSTHEAPKPTYPAASSTSDSEYMTSVMYETKVFTVTACPSTVPDCPVGHKTSTIITRTTVCPVVPTKTPEAPKPTSSASPSSTSEYMTSTLYETKVFTVTACPPTVPDCPVGHKTSTIITRTTVCPVVPTKTPEGPSKQTYPPGVPVESKTNQGPAPTPIGKPSASVPVAPYPTYPAPSVVTKPYSTGSPTGSYPAQNTTVTITNGAASMQAGGLLMAVGLVAALL